MASRCSGLNTLVSDNTRSNHANPHSELHSFTGDEAIVVSQCKIGNIAEDV